MKIINVKHPLHAYRKFSTAAMLFFSAATILAAQSTPKRPAEKSVTPESRTSRDLEAARQNPLALRNWLYKMPKGADLHIHLTGAVYADPSSAPQPKTISAWTPPSWHSLQQNHQIPNAVKAKSQPRTPSKINISTTCSSIHFRCAASSPRPAKADTTTSSTPSANSAAQPNATKANGSTKLPRARPRKTNSIWKSWTRRISATTAASQTNRLAGRSRTTARRSARPGLAR